MRRRIAHARALAAVGNLPAAARELEPLRSAPGDDSVRDVARILLGGIYLEQGDYKRAEGLLEETFKARSAQNEGSIRSYFALAGQTVNGVRTHLERYRKFGLNIEDQGLPTEAAYDLNQLRLLTERVYEQAKTIRDESAQSKEKAPGADASALLEDAAAVRLRLARDEQERVQWQREVAEARQRLVASETRIASISAAPIVEVKTVSTPAPSVAPASSFTTRSRASDSSSRPSSSDRPPARSTESAKARNTTTAAPPPKQTDAQSKSPANVDAGGKPLPVGSLHDKATQRVSPSYPQTAKSARISGVVTVFLLVDEDGTVAAVERTNGPALLQRAAADAARRWKFRPTLIDGQAVRVSGFISFNFAL